MTMRKRIGIKELKILLFIIVCLGVLIEPNYFAQNKESSTVIFIDGIYDVFKIFISLIIIAGYMFYFHYMQKKDILIIFALQFSMLLSTVINGTDLIFWFKGFRTIAIVSLLTSLMVDLGHGKVMIKAISVLFGIYSIISFATLILFPDGMYTHEIGYRNCWFLGYKNVAVPILLSGMIFSIYDGLIEKKRISMWAILTIICSEIYIFVVFSATGIIITALFLFLMLLYRFIPDLQNKIKCTDITIINFAVFFLLVSFRVQDKIAIIKSFVGSFGKDTTLSGRTELWDYALNAFRNSWAMGIGVRDGNYYVMSSGKWWAVHLHSYYLQEMVEGGIISFVIFFILLFLAAYHYDKSSFNQASSALKIGFLSFLAGFQLETYGQVACFYILLIIMLNIEYVEIDIKNSGAINYELGSY